MNTDNIPTARKPWRNRLHEIIFEADTPAGKSFDVILILAILISVGVVILDSVSSIRAAHGKLLNVLEWSFTILFTIEYILRLACVGKPGKYASSFFGVIDLLCVLPTYISLLYPGGHYLLAIRVLRTIRIFRILKLVSYLGAADHIMLALRVSRRKIIVFLFAVLLLVVVLGSLIYVVEGEAHGFTSIPRSIYWAVVTLTTVGYGDISPQTPLGQSIAAMIMILGYGIIAVPTGIVTAEVAIAASKNKVSTQACPECAAEGHDYDAVHCKICGARL